MFEGFRQSPSAITPATLVHLIAEHCQRYPALEPRDVYKLLYQGLRGPEHLVTSPDDFAAQLSAEYRSVDPDDKALLWETVRSDGELGRVHLRPFKARAGDLAALTSACLATARHPWGSIDDVRASWAAFVAGCRAGKWAFPLGQVLAPTRWLEEQGYPPAHHSEAYRASYRPAYRWVGRAWMQWVE